MKFFVQLPVAVAQSSSGGVVIRYVRLVLWMMSHLAVMGRVLMWYWGGVCCLWIPCCCWDDPVNDLVYQRRPSWSLCVLCAGVLWSYTKGCIWRRAHCSVWEVWHNLGPASDDGPHDWIQSQFLLCYIHWERRCQWGRQTGDYSVVWLITGNYCGMSVSVKYLNVYLC